MLNLFKTEMLHFRNWAVGFAVFYFLVLYYLYSVGVAFFEWPVSNMGLLGQVVIGASFGVVQMKLHKRPNEWLYLLHRPLSPRKIFVAITLAGCCLLLAAVTLPALILVVAMDVDGRLLVEFRHYLFPLYSCGLLLTAYFCGCLSVLSPNRLAFVAIAICAFIIAPFFNFNSAILVNSVFTLTWAFCLAYQSFKPDLARNFQRIRQLLLSELGIQFGILWGLGLVINIYYSATIDENSPSRAPAQGSDYHAFQLSPRERILYALENSSHPEAAFLSQQTLLGEITQVRNPHRFSHPVRHQLPQYDNQLLLNDEDRRESWSFSHNTMMFQGRLETTGEFAGWLGSNGFHDELQAAEPFISVPWVTGNAYIIDDSRIFHLDWDTRLLKQRFASDDGARFTDSLAIADNLTTLLSEKFLYLFATPEFIDPNRPLKPVARVEIPSPDNPVMRTIDVLELIDGFLVSALVDRTATAVGNDFARLNRARLQVTRTRQGKENEIVASMELPTSFSSFFLYNTLVVSPGLRSLSDLLFGLARQKNVESTLPLFTLRLPGETYSQMLLLCLSSAALVAWLLRRSDLPGRIKGFWIVLTCFTGIAGLVSFLLGTYWGKADQLKIQKTK